MSSSNFLINEWHKTWDFQARDLSLEIGNPSMVGYVAQDRIPRLDFFGQLGAFVGDKSKIVAFAQIFQNLPLGVVNKGISFTHSSIYQDLIFKFVLFSKQVGEQFNYQYDFQSSPHKIEISLTAKDFKCFRRGELIPNASNLELSSVNRIGFMVTRSSQKGATAVAREMLPFGLSIWDIKFS